MNIKEIKECIKQNFKRNIFLYFALLIVLLYLLPYYVLNQNVPALIHDNLDYNEAMLKILVESGKLFSPNSETIPNIMNGLPRLSFPSEWNFIVLLYYLFEPFTAYIINLTFMHFVAFFGMYILLKTHFINDTEHEIIIIGTAVCFALLPFYPSRGLTIAGQPLLLYSFLNIRADVSTKKDWLILFFIPFYSSFILGFGFFICAMGFIWLYDIASTKRININMLVAIIFMSCMFLLVEYRLVLGMFLDTEFVSHRVDFNLQGGLILVETIVLIIRNFILGQYHAASLQQYFVGISVVIALLIIFSRKLEHEKTFIILLICIALISVWHGFSRSEFWYPLSQNYTLLRIFQFDRFHSLQPLLWYILFGLALRIIHKNIHYKNVNFGEKIIFILVILQIVFIFIGNAGVAGYKQFYNSNSSDITYKQFYAEDIFQAIKEDIGQPQENYRVVSIGIHPSIAQYNGFYTLDGYVNNYPLDYKHQFRKIIEKELAKDDRIKNYFDDWGSRCYIFVAELDGCGYTKYVNGKIKNLELNMDVMKNMGGKYVFSAVEIINSEYNQLNLLNIYENENSVWRIFLYQII